jgi:hypothetical protein
MAHRKTHHLFEDDKSTKLTFTTAPTRFEPEIVVAVAVWSIVLCQETKRYILPWNIYPLSDTVD